MEHVTTLCRPSAPQHHHRASGERHIPRLRILAVVRQNLQPSETGAAHRREVNIRPFQRQRFSNRSPVSSMSAPHIVQQGRRSADVQFSCSWLSTNSRPSSPLSSRIRGSRSISFHSCANRSSRRNVANSRFTEAAETGFPLRDGCRLRCCLNVWIRPRLSDPRDRMRSAAIAAASRVYSRRTPPSRACAHTASG